MDNHALINPSTGTTMHRTSLLRRLRSTRVGQLVPLLLIIAALTIVPELTGASASRQNLANRLQPPVWLGGEWSYPLGTDGLGRDLAARVMSGARTSLRVSTIAAGGAAIIGVVAGIVSGVGSPWLDRLIGILVDTIIAVPFITVALMVAATIGAGVTSMLVLLIGTGWITYARVLRLQARVIGRADYVTAARTLGASRAHLFRVHYLPAISSLAIVVFFQQIGAMLLWSASLTWLGVGMPIETITLGGIVRDGQDLLYTAWWVSAAGGLALVLLVCALNLAADWCRLQLDPLSRSEQQGVRA